MPSKKNDKKEKDLKKKKKIVKTVKAVKKSKESKHALKETVKSVENLQKVAEDEVAKRDSLIKFIIPLLVGIAAVAVLLVIGITKFKFEFSVEEDGYAIPTSTVLSSMDPASQDSAPLYKFKTGDAVYSMEGNVGKHFIGEDKQGISPRYPMFTRNGQVLYFLDDSTPIITNEWDTIKPYEGLRLSNGETYNADNSRANLDEIILVDCDYGYQVAQETSIYTEHSDKSIPMNTICEFGENRVDCFEFNNGMITSYSLNVSRDAHIKIGNNDMSYNDFLVNIGVYKKDSGSSASSSTQTADEAEQQESEESKTKTKTRTTTTGDLPVKKEASGEIEHAKEHIERHDTPLGPSPRIPDWELPVVTFLPVGETDKIVNPWVYYFGLNVDVYDPAGVISSKGVRISSQLYTSSLVFNTPLTPALETIKASLTDAGIEVVDASKANGKTTIKVLSRDSASAKSIIEGLVSGVDIQTVNSINKAKSPTIALRSTNPEARLAIEKPDTEYVLSYTYVYKDANASEHVVERFIGVEYVEDGDDEHVYKLDAEGHHIIDPTTGEDMIVSLYTDGVLNTDLIPVYKTLGYDELDDLKFFFDAQDVGRNYDTFQIQDLYFPNMVCAYKTPGQTDQEAIEAALADQKMPDDPAVRERTAKYTYLENYINSVKIEYTEGVITPTEEGKWPSSLSPSKIKSFALNSSQLSVLTKGFVLDYVDVGTNLKPNTTYTYRIVIKDKFMDNEQSFIYAGTAGDGKTAINLHNAKTIKTPPHVDITVPSKLNRADTVTINVKLTNSDLCDIAQGSPDDNYLFLTKDGDAVTPENAIEVTYILLDSSGLEVDGTHITSKHLPVSAANEINITGFKIIDGLEMQSLYNAGVYCRQYDNDDVEIHHDEILDNKTSFLTGSLTSYGTIQYQGYVDNITHQRADAYMRLTYNKNETLFESHLLEVLTHIDITTTSLSSSTTFTLKKEELEAIPIVFGPDAPSVSGISTMSVTLPVHIDNNDNPVLAAFDLIYPTSNIPQIQNFPVTDPLTYRDPVNVWEFILATSNVNGSAYFKTRLSQIYTLPEGSPLQPGKLVDLQKTTAYTTTLKFMASNGGGKYEDVTSASSKPLKFTTLKVEPYIDFADVFISNEFIEIYNLAVVDPDETISPDKTGQGNILVRVLKGDVQKDRYGFPIYDEDGNEIPYKTDELVTSLFINSVDYPDRSVSDTQANETIRIDGLEKDKYYYIEVLASEYINDKTYSEYPLMLVLGDTLTKLDEDVIVREYEICTKGKITGDINIDSLFRSYTVGEEGEEQDHIGLLKYAEEEIDSETGTYKYGDWTRDENDVYTSKHVDVDTSGAYQYSVFSNIKEEKKTSPNNLPSYFKEVDYIQANGSQYIKLGYFHNPKSEFYFEVQPVRGANTWNIIFGSRSATLKSDTWDFGYNDNSTYECYMINTPLENKDYLTQGTPVILDFANFQTIKVGPTVATFDGVEVQLFTDQQVLEQGASCGTALFEDYLFAMNNNGAGPAYQSRMKLRAARISEDGIVLHNFVPCVAMQEIPAYMVNTGKKAIVGTAGLYDTVGKIFYVSSDKNFAYAGGEPEEVKVELPEGIERIDYIEASGAQWLDTGYYHDYNTIVDVVLLPHKGTNTWNAIFGSRTANTAKDTLDFGYNDATDYNSYFLNNKAGNYNTILAIKDYSSWNTVHLDSEIMSCDGVSAKTNVNGAVGNAVFSDFIFQFNINNAPTANHYARAKIKSFKITDNTTGYVYRNFVPVIATREVTGVKATGFGYDSLNIDSTTTHVQNRNVDRNGDYLVGTTYTIPAGTRGLWDAEHNVFYRSAVDNNFDGPETVEDTLPDNFEQVKYIASNRAQWIDTGILANGNTTSVFDFSLIDFALDNNARKSGKNTYYDGPRWSTVFGYRDSYARNAWKYSLWLHQSNDTWYPSYGNYTVSGKYSDYDTGVKVVRDKRYYIVMNGGDRTADRYLNDADGNYISPLGKGLQIYDANWNNVVNFPYTLPTSGSPSKAGYSIEIFNINDDGNKDPNGANNGAYKLFSGKIYQRNTANDVYELIADLVPAISKEQIPANKVSTGVAVSAYTPGLYDKVSGMFFVNNGSGQFTYQRYVEETQEDSITGKYTVTLWKHDVDAEGQPVKDEDGNIIYEKLKEITSDLIGNGNVFGLPSEYVGQENLTMTIQVRNIPNGHSIADVHLEEFDKSKIANYIDEETGEEISRNLLWDLPNQPNGIIDGYIYDEKGNRVATEGYAVTSDFTPVKPDSVYFVEGLSFYQGIENKNAINYNRPYETSIIDNVASKFDSSSHPVTFYNENKEYIATANVGAQGALFKTPSNAAYVRFVLRGNLDSIKEADVQEDSELKIGIPYTVNTYGTRYKRNGGVYVSFKPTESGTYTITSRNAVSGDPYIVLCDENKEEIKVDDVTQADDDGEGNLNFKLVATLEKNKTYYLRVTHSNQLVASALEYDIYVSDNRYLYDQGKTRLYLYTPANEAKFTATFSGQVQQIDDELTGGKISVKLFKTKNKVTIATNLDEYTDDMWEETPTIIYRRPDQDPMPPIPDITEELNPFNNVSVIVDADYGYKAELYAEKNGRNAEILLDTTKFTAVQPVYVIKDIPSLRKVASDMAGYYICIADLPAGSDGSEKIDFTVSDEIFTGVIDWQGHTINLSSSNPLFGRLGSDAVFRNANFVYEKQESGIIPFTPDYLRATDIKYYAVDFLRSPATQYIRTGVIVNENISVDMDMAIDNFGVNWSAILGARTANHNNNSYVLCRNNNTAQLRQEMGNQHYAYSGNLAANTKYKIEVTKNSLKVNGTSYGVSGAPATIPGGLELYIFGLNENNHVDTVYGQMPYRIYGCKIKDGEELIRDLVPVVRSTDMLAGLYDKENDQFYPGNGKGKFSFGEYLKDEDDKQIIYYPPTAGEEDKRFIALEYVEATGRQHLVLPQVQRNTVDYEFKFERTSKASAEQNIIGWNAATNNRLSIALLNDGITAQARIVNNRTFNISNLNLNKPVVYKLTQTSFIVDDGVEHMTDIVRDTYAVDTKVTVFSANAGIAAPAYGKLYYLKMYDEGTLCFNGVPVMAAQAIENAWTCVGDNTFGQRTAPAGTIGLYDRISDKFFFSVEPLLAPPAEYDDTSDTAQIVFNNIELTTNNNTRDLPNDFVELDYIRSGAGQKIDTGLTASQGLHIQMRAGKIAYNAAIGTPFGAGCYQWSNTGLTINMNQTQYYFYYRKCVGPYGFTDPSHDIYFFDSYVEGSTGYIKIYNDPDGDVDISTASPLTQASAVAAKAFNETRILVFGASSSNGEGDRSGSMDLYNCKIFSTHNGYLVRDFVPCIAINDIPAEQSSLGKEVPSGTVGLYDKVTGLFYSSKTGVNFYAPTATKVNYYTGTEKAIENAACIARDNYGTLSNIVLHYGPKTASAYAVGNNSACMVVNNYGTIDTFALELTRDINVKNNMGGVCLHNYGTISNGYVGGKNFLDANNDENVAGFVHRNKTITAVYGIETKKVVPDDPYNPSSGTHDEYETHYVYEKEDGVTDAGNISYIASFNDARGRINNVYVAANLKIESKDSTAGPYGNWSKGVTYVADSLIQVESIRTYGAQYIDTGIIADANTYFEGNVLFYSAPGSDHTLFGTIGSNVRYHFGWNIPGYKGNNYTSAFTFNTADLNNKINIKFDNTHKLRTTRGGVVTKEVTLNGSGNLPNGTAYLFARHNISSNKADTFVNNMELYDFKIWQTIADEEGGTHDEMLRDFIPAMASENIDGSRTNTGGNVIAGTVGLYDKVSGLFFVNSGTGAFSCVGTFDKSAINTDFSALITGNNSGSIKDSFAAGDIIDVEYRGNSNGLAISKTTVMKRIGPAIGANDGYDISNINYVSPLKATYENKLDSATYMHSFNESSELKSLHDYKWYEDKLGKDGVKFNIRNQVASNYYPQIIMSDYISASKIPSFKLPDSVQALKIIGTEVRQKGLDKYGNQVAVATLMLDNPSAYNIKNINIVDSNGVSLDTEVVAQDKFENSYRVDVLVTYVDNDFSGTIPLAQTTYTISTYDTNSSTGVAFNINGENSIDLDFYHEIRSIGDWSAYLGGLSDEINNENYHVAADLDFSLSSTYQDWLVYKRIQGVIDGGEYAYESNQNMLDFLGNPILDINDMPRKINIKGDLIGMYTISGVGNTTSAGKYALQRSYGNNLSNNIPYNDVNAARFGIFRLLNGGKVTNFIFKDFKTVLFEDDPETTAVNEANSLNDVTNAISGIVAIAQNGAMIDNVHVRDSIFNTRGYGGGIVAYANNTTIVNSSVRNSTINGKNYPLVYDPTYLGGLYGYGYNVDVENCFVSNISINGDGLTTLAGAGGLAGVADFSSFYASYAGNGSISVSGDCVGGIVGKVGNAANTAKNEFNYGTSIENCWTTISVQTDGDFVGGLAGYMGIYNGTEDRPEGNKMVNNFTNSTVLTMNYGATHANRFNSFNFESANYYYNNFAFTNQSLNYKNAKASEPSGTYQFGPTTNLNGATRLISADDIREVSTWIGEMKFDNEEFELTEAELTEKELMPKLKNTHTGELLYDQYDEDIATKNVAKLEVTKARNIESSGYLKIEMILWNYGWDQDTFREYYNKNYTAWKDLAKWDDLTAVGGFAGSEEAVLNPVVYKDKIKPINETPVSENGNYGLKFEVCINYTDPTLGHYADSYLVSVPVYLTAPGTSPRLEYSAFALIVLDEDNIAAKLLRTTEDWNAFFSPTGSHYNTLETIKIADPGEFIFNPTASNNAYNAGIDKVYIASDMNSSSGHGTGKPYFSTYYGGNPGTLKISEPNASFISQISGDVSGLHFENFYVDYDNQANAGGQGIIGTLSAGLLNTEFINVGVSNTQGTSTGIIGEAVVGSYLDNIKLSGVTITPGNGKSNVGGLIGKITGANAHHTTIKNVTADNINVRAAKLNSSESNFGGLFGNILYTDLNGIKLINNSTQKSKYFETGLYTNHDDYELFQEVEYLECTGADQRINTGIKQSNTLVTTLEFQMTAVDGAYYPIGAVNGSAHYYMPICTSTDARWKVQSGAGGKEIFFGTKDYEKHVFSLGPASTKKAVMDPGTPNELSATVGTYTVNTAASGIIHVFGMNGSTSRGWARIYSAKFEDNFGDGTTSRLFVPVIAKKEIPADKIAYNDTSNANFTHTYFNGTVTVPAGTPGLYEVTKGLFYPVAAQRSDLWRSTLYAGPKIGYQQDGTAHKYNVVEAWTKVGGIVGYAGNSSFSNITLENVSVKGIGTHAGGVVAHAENSAFDNVFTNVDADGNITDINTARSIYVDTRSNYSGGVVGQAATPTSFNKIFDKAVVSDVSILGNSHVGGLIGETVTVPLRFKDFELSDVRIVGMAANVAGAVGHTSGLILSTYNCKFKDIIVENDDELTGSKTDIRYAGAFGLIENSDGVNIDLTTAENLRVKGHQYIGGFAGQLQNVTSKIYSLNFHNSHFKNFDVLQQYYSTGSDGLVGGVVGEISYMDCYADNGTTVEDFNIQTNGGACGGFVGYLYQASEATVRAFGSHASSDWEPGKPDYTRVSFLQSNGAQYINTGIIPDINTRVLIVDEVSNGNSAFGINIDNAQYHYTGNATPATYNMIRLGSYELTTMQPITVGKYAKIDFFKGVDRYLYNTDSNAWEIIRNTAADPDLAHKGTVNYAFPVYDKPMFLFARNYNNAINDAMIGKIYECWIWQNCTDGSDDPATSEVTDGKLVRHFVPVKRNSDGIYGMLDISGTYGSLSPENDSDLNGVFYPNKGTGAFTAIEEQEVTGEYTELEALSSANSAGNGYWIDSGVTADATATTAAIAATRADSLKLEFETIVYGENFDRVFGFYESTIPSRFLFQSTSSSLFELYMGASSDFVGLNELSTGKRAVVFGKRQKYEIQAKSNDIYVKVDDKLIYENKSKTINLTKGKHIGIFNLLNNAGTLFTDNNNRRVTLYNMKIWKESASIANDWVLVRDFKPVKRNIDQALGLYDSVEEKFYQNKGVETFIPTYKQDLSGNKDYLKINNVHIDTYGHYCGGAVGRSGSDTSKSAYYMQYVNLDNIVINVKRDGSDMQDYGGAAGCIAAIHDVTIGSEEAANNVSTPGAGGGTYKPSVVIAGYTGYNIGGAVGLLGSNANSGDERLHEVYNVNVYNTKLEGSYANTSRIGGISGYVRSVNIHDNLVENVTINGAGCDGGILGYKNPGTADAYNFTNNNTVKETIITGSGTDKNYGVGGIVGYDPKTNIDASIHNNTVDDCFIAANVRVGGIVGAVAKTNIYGNTVQDTTILSDYGRSVGGIVGFYPNSNNDKDIYENKVIKSDPYATRSWDSWNIIADKLSQACDQTDGEGKAITTKTSRYDTINARTTGYANSYANFASKINNLTDYPMAVLADSNVSGNFADQNVGGIVGNFRGKGLHDCYVGDDVLVSSYDSFTTGEASANRANVSTGGLVGYTTYPSDLNNTNFDANYIQLDYLETEGHQYINTVCTTTRMMKVETKFAMNPASYSYSNAIFGGGWTSNVFLVNYQGGNKFYFHGPGVVIWQGLNDSPITITVNRNNNNVNIVASEEGNASRQNVTINTTDSLAQGSALHILLSNGWNTGAYVKSYYYKIWDNGSLIRDLIPVMRRADGQVGFYDKIYHRFYPNADYANRGNFTPGYEVSTKGIVTHTIKDLGDDVDGKTVGKISYGGTNYEVVDYVLSNGAQFINSGIVPIHSEILDDTVSPAVMKSTTGTKWEFDYAFNTNYGRNTDGKQGGNAQIGSGNNDTIGDFLIYLDTSGHKYRYALGGLYSPEIPNDYGRHTFALDSFDRSASFDGEKLEIIDKSRQIDIANRGPIYLFARNNSNGGAAAFHHSAKMYSSKVWFYSYEADGVTVNEEIQQYLIPVRKKISDTPLKYEYGLLDIKDISPTNWTDDVSVTLTIAPTYLTATGLSGGFTDAHLSTTIKDKDTGTYVPTETYIYDCVVGANVISFAKPEAESIQGKESTGGIIGCFGVKGYTQTTATGSEVIGGKVQNTMRIYNGRDVNLLKGPNATSIYNFLFKGTVQGRWNASLALGGAYVEEISQTFIDTINKTVAEGGQKEYWKQKGESNDPYMYLYYDANGVPSTNPASGKLTTTSTLYPINIGADSAPLTTNGSTGSLYLRTNESARNAGLGRMRYLNTASQTITTGSTDTAADLVSRAYEDITADDANLYNYIAGHTVTATTLSDATKMNEFYYGDAKRGKMSLGSSNPEIREWWVNTLGGTGLTSASLPPMLTTTTAPKNLASGNFAKVSNLEQLVTNMKAYSSGIDTINLELDSKPGSMLNYEITSLDGKVSGIWPAGTRTITLTYDYNSDIIVTLSNGDKSFSKTFGFNRLANTVMTYGNGYWYTYNNKVLNAENKSVKDGVTFVHMADGKLLDNTGAIYDAQTGNKISKARALSVIDAKPLWSGTIDTQGETHNVKTFATYSLSDNVTIDGRLYVKGSTLYTLSAAKDIISGPVIDTYAGTMYATVVLDNNVIKDLGTALKYPENFNVNEVKEISNTMNYNGHIVLVRYENDSLVAFDYLTGSIVAVNYEEPTITETLGSFFKTSLKNLFRPSEASKNDTGMISDANKYEENVSKNPNYANALEELKQTSDYQELAKEKEDNSVINEEIIKEETREDLRTPTTDKKEDIINNEEIKKDDENVNDKVAGIVDPDKEKVTENTEKSGDNKTSNENGQGDDKIYTIENSYVALYNKDSEKPEIFEASEILSKPIQECISEDEKAAMLEKVGLKTLMPPKEEASQNTLNGVLLIVLIIFALAMLITIMFYIRRRTFAEEKRH